MDGESKNEAFKRLLRAKAWEENRVSYWVTRSGEDLIVSNTSAIFKACVQAIQRGELIEREAEYVDIAKARLAFWRGDILMT